MDILTLSDLPRAFAAKGKSYYNSWNDLKQHPVICSNNLDLEITSSVINHISYLVERYNIRMSEALYLSLGSTPPDDNPPFSYLFFSKPLSVLFESDFGQPGAEMHPLSDFKCEVAIYYEIDRYRRKKKLQKEA